ncbi:FAD-dependent oxidoreductase [Helcobacillus massiliensis]|uniref:GcvT family protein n=1 Tax=Helcobacillus massiliensis TaxID=521392 RepID=UPI0021A3F9E6|nr:FAD-dependent oxidoreductase [Helcobacillus massiliensis]MCT1557946.1 FAD-dependent oxidoreductase [Helcobacillus massiliensis]MCT2037345.1 FAD-dependent oxidoreductase [Helcobacillus massiliensis]MCT2332948.1 FAD-dependent oxidoreductase [Helcobacillus massiliensis]
MTAQPRIVIIGAGIVGANLADELVDLGFTNTLVLERGPRAVPGGSTSHAPGLVFQTNATRAMTRFAMQTSQKMRQTVQHGRSCYNEVGGLEVATTNSRLEDLRRKAGWGHELGLGSRILDPGETARLFPLVNTEMILGALYVPSDGLALARRFTDLLVERSKENGVEYRYETAVTGIESTNGRVTGVRAGDEVIPADIVVSCAGFWGPEIGDMAGVKVPLLPLAHQYAWTQDIPELKPHRKPGTDATLPLLRFQDRDLYYRQVDGQLGIGSYAHRPMPADARTLSMNPSEINLDRMPSSLDFTPEDFQDSWADSQLLLPALRGTDVQRGFNGIFSFTADGGSVIGEAPELSGFFLAEAVWVTHSAAIARAVAQLIVRGEAEIDISSADVARFDGWQKAEQYVEMTSKQSFVEIYDVRHPDEPKLFPRGVMRSPFHGDQKQRGAVFLEASGWERPHWYEENARLLPGMPPEWAGPVRSEVTGKFSSPIVAAEAWKTRTAVAMYDMTALRRAEVTGPGAAGLLQSLCTSKVDRAPGAITYTLLLNDRGGIRSDITVARLGEELFQVGINSARDVSLLQKCVAAWVTEHGPACHVQVRDITAETCCIGLWGPDARRVLQKITNDDISTEGLGYFRAKQIMVGSVPVVAMRLSYVGELGWELYTPAGFGAELWEMIARSGEEFGIIAAGRAAFNALRLEKGYRSWGSDMCEEHTPAEAGLSFAVGRTKTGYTGQQALAALAEPVDGAAPSARDAATRGKRLRTLTVDDRMTVLLGNETVFAVGADDDQPMGYVTSTEWGPTVGRTVALAWVDDNLAEGDAVEIEFYGRRVRATVAADVLVDPSMEKIRA